MAEIAISALALGVMYIFSNRKNKEGYMSGALPMGDAFSPEPNSMIDSGGREWTGECKTKHRGDPTQPITNFPKQTYRDVGENVASFPSPNTATDRYFRQGVYEEKVQNGENPNNSLLFKSMTGNSVQKKDLKFNNMVPFFGSKVTQRTGDLTENEGMLDTYTGNGSQVIHKKERAPLFAPQANLNYSNGVPNNSDFIQSRVNPSTNANNVKPWKEIRVGPGLNKGYGEKGSGGFNSGMESRDKWIDKTVSELRTKTNPKVTFSLDNHEGPSNCAIKKRGFEGKVEKNRPDTYFINTPDRWLTTGGQEKGQRNRAEEPLQSVNRIDTTRDYYGAATTDQGASTGGRLTENYKKSSRPILDPDSKYLGAAHNQNTAGNGSDLKQNYGRSGYKSYPNSRNTTKQTHEFGAVHGLLKAAIAPIFDILRPTKKDDGVNNRAAGISGGCYGVKSARVWNPAERTKTTIREQTEKTYDLAQPHYKRDGAYETTEHHLLENNRQSTNIEYIGGGGGGHNGTSNATVYNAAYNAELNPDKETLLKNQINVGCNPTFNSEQNIRMVKREPLGVAQGNVSMPKVGGNVSMLGQHEGKNIRSEYSNRNESNLLDAHKNNPYTHSLHSIY
jgi:hypothetical protein